MGQSMKHESITIYRAGAVQDAAGCSARDGAIAVSGGRVIAAGSYDEIPRRIRENAQLIDRRGELLIPAMVNAHAHLDLAGLAPSPYAGDFLAWLRDVMGRRPTTTQEITAAVHLGLAMSRQSGVAHVGDIAGSPTAIIARQQAPADVSLPGVSYLECFGLGDRQTPAIEQAAAALDALPFEVPLPPHARGIVLGLSPHAPYSAGQTLYEQATQLSHARIYRLSTHLAESLDEIAFIRSGTGPFVDMLKDMGKWDDSIKPTGKHPIDWLEPQLKHGRWLVAHCNYVEDDHIELLSKTGTSVAYCPIASDYFGHRGHRYRDMLAQDVNVCLGTDSILCQPPANGTNDQPLSIMAQMRHLFRRDGTDPLLLLKMATTNGMIALELAEADATFAAGAPAIFAALPIDSDSAVDPLTQALASDQPVQTIDATAPSASDSAIHPPAGDTT